MIAENQIREKAIRFLSREISLDHFEDWISEQSWNMHKDSEEAAQKLASAIELRLGEHSSGHLDEICLREELRSLVSNHSVSISFGEAPLKLRDEPPDNVAPSVAFQLLSFPIVREDSHPAASPDASGFADTKQLVAHA
jgi:hypothetical protein